MYWNMFYPKLQFGNVTKQIDIAIIKARFQNKAFSWAEKIYLSDWLKAQNLKTNQSEVQMNGEIWRFWTYQFLHANIEHILSNILVASLLGITLEMVHGPLSYDFKLPLLSDWLFINIQSNQFKILS